MTHLALINPNHPDMMVLLTVDKQANMSVSVEPHSGYMLLISFFLVSKRSVYLLFILNYNNVALDP